MRSAQTLIIGGGPSGLSLAYHLQGDTLILEKENEVGGLCRSIERDGGMFDIGGHSFHTPHPEVDSLVTQLMGDGWSSQQRDARVYTHGTLIPYPFQKFYDRIPDPDAVEDCRQGLLVAGNAEGAENFEEYILQRFGRGVAEHFMWPYNRKIWARDLKRMSCEWTSERVAAPKGNAESFETNSGKRRPLQADTSVGYPARGGYVEIFKSFVPHLPAVELGQQVVRIDPLRKVVFTRSGASYGWNRLVSTMPIPILLRLIDDTPAELIALADKLEYMSLNLLLLLVGRQLPHAPQRIYVADPDIPPHKIAFNHHSSDDLRDRPVHAIMAEISYSAERPLGDPAEVERRTIEFLIGAGILESAADVTWTEHVDVRYAYPVYTHERPEILGVLQQHLRRLDIRTLGRFGEWEYINSDRCIQKGLDLARELRAEMESGSALTAAAV